MPPSGPRLWSSGPITTLPPKIVCNSIRGSSELPYIPGRSLEDNDDLLFKQTLCDLDAKRLDRPIQSLPELRKAVRRTYHNQLHRGTAEICIASNARRKETTADLGVYPSKLVSRLAQCHRWRLSAYGVGRENVFA